jgi:uncharacterized protein
VIFVDSNVLMYIVGKDHPHKFESLCLIERLTGERRRLVTSCEVFQELLHRYVAAGRRDKVELAFHTLDGIIDNVFSVRHEDVFLARALTNACPGLSARGALHAAVMRRAHVREILSFDRGFDLLPDIVRIAREGG